MIFRSKTRFFLVFGIALCALTAQHVTARAADETSTPAQPSALAKLIEQVQPAQTQKPAAAENISEARLKLARDYVAILPIEEDIKKAIDDVLPRIPIEQRALYRSIADSGVDYNRVRTAAQLNLAEIFTENELKAMIDFYSKPEGKSIREKMATYDVRMNPVMGEVMQAFAKRLQEAGITVNP